MRTNLIRNVNGYIAFVALVTCPFLAAPAHAISTQNASPAASKSIVLISRPGTDKTAKSTVLARNTPAKEETPAVETTAPKEPKTHDKKTISRCWNRLMNMVREANHAHKQNNK
jgi:hypothetical protein